MPRKRRTLLPAIVLGLLLASGFVGVAGAQPIEQAKVEAAITMQILSFTVWPDELSASEKTRIGIFSSEEASEAFELLLQDERYRDRYEVVQIEPKSTDAALDELQAIFFGSPDPVEVPRLIRRLEGKPVVLAGSYEGFLDQGGMINLVRRQKRLTFEIDLGNAKAHRIAFRAKLLRLAAEVSKE